MSLNLKDLKWDTAYKVLVLDDTEYVDRGVYPEMMLWTSAGTDMNMSVDMVSKEFVEFVGEEGAQDSYESGDDIESFISIDQIDIGEGKIIIEELVD